MWSPLVLLLLLDAAQAATPRLPPGLRAFTPDGLEKRAQILADQHTHLLMSRAAVMNATNSTNTTTYQFRTNKTEKYLVKSLPDVDFDIGEMYAGSISIKSNSSSASSGSSGSSGVTVTGGSTQIGPVQTASAANFVDVTSSPTMMMSSMNASTTASASAIPAPGSNSSSGNLTDNGELFFIFKPKTGEPVKEITIWLNGGPGCSSMEGFFQENGPVLWQQGTYGPVANPYSWSNLTNMLWVDQPIGTGFSTGTPYATNQKDVAGPFVKWFKNWQQEFGIQDYKIYITGESYAGKYVPYLAAEMLDQNDTQHFNVSGIMVYDPCIGEYNTVQNEIPALPFVQNNWNLFGFNESFMGQLEEMHQKCGYDAWINQYLTFPPAGQQPPQYFNFTGNVSCDIYDTIYGEAFNINPCFNPYEINTMCPLPFDVLGYPGVLLDTPKGMTIYFDRDDVKEAIHAPKGLNWTECSSEPVFVGKGGPQNAGDLSPDPIQGVLPKVIEATNRVLVSNGDFDYVIITNGTLMAIQNMTWHGQMGFQSRPTDAFYINQTDIMYNQQFNASGYGGLDGPQGQLGIQHFERGLMWVEVWQAGHMVPQYQPRAAYLQLQWLLGRVDYLGGPMNGTQSNGTMPGGSNSTMSGGPSSTMSGGVSSTDSGGGGGGGAQTSGSESSIMTTTQSSGSNVPTGSSASASPSATGTSTSINISLPPGILYSLGTDKPQPTST